MKTYRRTIRINGEEIKSPRFTTKADADNWYHSKLREKNFEKGGVELPIDSKKSLNEFFDKTWFPRRQINYPKATWYSDQQRYNDYIRKPIGNKKVSRITSIDCRKALKNVVDVHNLSIQTRNRVRALMSVLFNDAMNEDPPLCKSNPAFNISFGDGKRLGRKTPSHLKRHKDILDFMSSAKKLSDLHFVYASIALMAGLRKSEMIALKWNDFDASESELRVDEKFEQASMTLKQGTKGGEFQERNVVISDDLTKTLSAYKKRAEFKKEADFILCDQKGRLITPRVLHTLHSQICKASGVAVTPHGLRHTYGREFVKNGGSMKALQTILGHSNTSVTELYSELAGKEVKKHRNTVSFDLDFESETDS